MISTKAAAIAKRRRKRGAFLVPTEEQEMRVLAQWLDAIGAVWLHPANEGKRSVVTGARLKAMGLKPGAPDVLVFSPPHQHVHTSPRAFHGGFHDRADAGRGMGSGVVGSVAPRSTSRETGFRGVAIELKRKKGGKESVAQAWWLSMLDSLGWEVQFCYGADDAIIFLKGLGYGLK